MGLSTMNSKLKLQGISPLDRTRPSIASSWTGPKVFQSGSVSIGSRRASPARADIGFTAILLALDPTPSIISIFPYPFHLSYVVTLTKHELSTDLHVVNPSAKDSLLAAAQTVSDAVTSALPTAVTGSESKPQDKGLRFQALFHTYLAVSDSSTVKAQGLRSGLNYVDKMKGGSKEVWEGGDLKFDQAVDR
jgi:glucose-6-phosphate 1-epimerase